MLTRTLKILSVLVAWFAVACAEAAADSLWADNSPHEPGFIEANGIKLHYLDWGGKGETILFLHGLGDTAHIFDDLAPMFTDQFRVISLTRRGHGESDKPEGGYDLATLVEDIRSFLDNLKIERVALVGHSVAGDELTRFSGLYPGRVSKLIYLDAAHDRTGLLEESPPELSPSSMDMVSLDSFRRWVSSMSFWSEAWEANLRQMMQAAPDGKILGEVKPGRVSRLIMEGTESPDYSKIRVPALNLAVIGFTHKVRDVVEALPESRRMVVEAHLERVQAFQRQEIERFQREVPIGTVVELENTDHYCFIQRREKVVHEMRKFLAP